MEKLNPQEEQLMQIIWQKGGGFVREFLEALPEPRPPYTTLASMVKNLEKKDYLQAEKMGNSYRYLPRISADEYKRRHMGGIVKNYFSNSYKELVAFFAHENKISAEELKEVLRMIEEDKSK